MLQRSRQRNIRYTNPEGEQEYLKPGDILRFVTDLTIFAFDVPVHDSRGSVTRLIEAKEGDLAAYIGVVFFAREFTVLHKVPLYQFVLKRVDDDGEVYEEVPFVIKNVETILKWTEKT